MLKIRHLFDEKLYVPELATQSEHTSVITSQKDVHPYLIMTAFFWNNPCDDISVCLHRLRELEVSFF